MINKKPPPSEEIREKELEAARKLSSQSEGFLPEKLSEASPDSVLAHMFRSIARDRGLNVPALKTMISRYLTDRYRIPGINNVSQDNKSNFIKDMMSEQMSWHSFLRNLTITQVVKFDFQIRLYHKNGTVSQHLNTVYLDPEEAEKAMKEENDHRN
jgi:hypothetical protein